MLYQTKYFGEVEADESEVFHFPSGLPGFEEEHSFLIIPFDGSDGTLFSLQSTVTPGLSFVVMDPYSLTADYEPVLTDADLHPFDEARWDKLSYCVLCCVKEPVSESTVNLKCPIVIDLEAKIAHQVIMDSDKYGMRHLLTEFSNREGSSSC